MSLWAKGSCWEVSPIPHRPAPTTFSGCWPAEPHLDPSTDPDLLEHLRLCAREWAAEAGRRLLARFGSELAVEYKGQGRGSPVSEVDREVEGYLRAAIAAEFPEHGVLGEEEEDRGPGDAEFWWVLDPLDGTTNYVNNLPLFGVSVAVLRHGVPQAGAIFVPGDAALHGGVYHCVRGGGSWLNDQRLTLASQPATERHLTALPAHYWWRFRPSGEMWRRMGEVRSLGSVVCELALTATGVFQYAAFGAPRIWDVAAGALLVAEAGGAVLVRESGRWHPLVAFTPPRRQSGPTGRLREWRAPLVAGNAETAPFVARELRGRGWLGTLLWGLWRLRRRLAAGRRRQKAEGSRQ